MEQKLHYICLTILITILYVWLTDMLEMSDSYSQKSNTVKAPNLTANKTNLRSIKEWPLLNIVFISA